ncbi:MAG: hypothetical protein AAGG51_11640 [Cyanobacteria bacterium P01_G01_bin.54]
MICPVLEESTFYQGLVRKVEARNHEKWYQEGFREGFQKGRIETLRKIMPLLRQWNVPLEPLLEVVGVTAEELAIEE